MEEGIGSEAAFAEADLRFHLLIVEASRNRLVAGLMDAIRTLLERVLALTFHVPGSPEAAIAMHRRILEAIAGGDPDAARARMREHLARAEREVGAVRALLVALAVALALPAAALAHAGLLSTTPGGDAVIAEAPKEVVLRFTEPVDASTATVQVLDGVARPVPTGALRQPDDRQIVVPIEGTLARGTYTVVWS